MKATSYLARFAALAFAGFAIGVAIDFGAIALFSVATAAVVLLGAFGEYAPRAAQSRVAAEVAARRREHMPLAA